MPAARAQRHNRKDAVPRKTAARSTRRRSSRSRRDAPHTLVPATPIDGELQAARRQTEAQLNALRAIQHVAHSLSSEVDLEPLLRKVLRAALDVMQADAGSLLLHDSSTDQLRFAVIEGGQVALEGRTLPSQQGLAGWVFTHGQPLVANDANQDARFYADFDKASGFQTTSLLAVPLIISGKKVGVLEVLNKGSRASFDESDVDVMGVLAAQSAIAIENARLYQHLWAERNRILAVEEDVRRDLARDMHDGPAQLLSALVMNVRFVQALLDDRDLDMAKQELISLEDLASRALKQMRELMFNQRPVVLETQGLFPTIETYVKRLSETRELNIQLITQCDPIQLPGKTDRTVFSIVQEAVGNALKNAPGAQVTIRLDHQSDQFIMQVSDDGPGFDVKRVHSTYDQRGSLGLLNMSERSQQIGGALRIESTQGKGTQVTLMLPTRAAKSV